jgi:hypothetical protein
MLSTPVDAGVFAPHSFGEFASTGNTPETRISSASSYPKEGDVSIGFVIRAEEHLGRVRLTA